MFGLAIMLEVSEVKILEVFEVLRVSILISSRKSLIFLSFSWSTVTSFLILQKCKVTILHLLDRELYCFKLTRDHVTTLTNYKGWVAFTTKVG